MAFYEIQFPPEVARGAKGGPGFMTDVVVLNSGYEQRNQRWSAARRRWNVAHGVKSQTQLDALIAFFNVVYGRTHGFRFKDWSDYATTTTTGYLGTGAVGTGAPTYQLYKHYTNAAGSVNRLISKPVSGSVTPYRAGSPITAGAGAGQYSIDTATGILTMVADSSKVINAITKANPGKITTSTAHGFTNGQAIYLAAIGGMTELNGTVVTITVVDTTNFTIGVNTSAYTTYTSGGTAAKYPQSSETMTCVSEFDVPARFDTDEMMPQVDDYGVYSWGEIPVVEIRV